MPLKNVFFLTLSTVRSADGDDEEEVVHMGNAIMSFYSALIDLLGRCAPEMHVCLIETVNLFVVFLGQISPIFTLLPFSLLQLINKGKGEALRIRAILRSLVPTEDLVGIISIPLKMPINNKGQDALSNDTQRRTVRRTSILPSEDASNSFTCHYAGCRVHVTAQWLRKSAHSVQGGTLLI